MASSKTIFHWRSHRREGPRDILDQFDNAEIELYPAFLFYILPLVNKFNIEFKSEKPKIHLLYLRVSSLFKTILKYYLKNEYVNNSNNIFKINPQIPQIMRSILVLKLRHY